MGALPFERLFAKGRLDVWSARAWAEGDPPDLVARIVALSVASGVATPHTAAVGFETTAARFSKFKALPPAERRRAIAKWALGGAAGVAVVAGVTLAATFGSLAATAANASAAAAMAAGGGGGGGAAAVGDAFAGGGGGGGDCGCCAGGHGDCGGGGGGDCCAMC